MTKKLIYNDKSSADMGLVIQAPPAYTIPERDVEKTHVPGRNGDVITDNGCYKNVVREYSLAKGYINGPVKTTVKNGQELFEWLTSTKGKYVRLEDDYDPEVYRMATYIETGSLTDLFDKAFAFNAKFECKPQRYLKLGEVPIEYQKGTYSVNINNLTHFDAKPKIKIKNIPTGTNATTLMSVKSNDGTEVALVTLKGNPDEFSEGTETSNQITIDSETEECYDEHNKNVSNRVSLNGKNFPVLKDLNTNISIEQYERKDYIDIPAYNSIIANNQEVCESAFSPKETTIASYEETYIIRPYQALIKERENLFDANTYETRLTEICDKGENHGGLDYALSYRIPSPNSYLSGSVIEFEKVSYTDFVQTFESYGLTDFLDIVQLGSYYVIKVKSGCVAYSRKANSGKKYKKYTNGQIIIDVNSSDYNVEDATLEILPDVRDSIKEDLPTFIDVTIKTNSDRELTSIDYKWDFTKYYFFEKTKDSSVVSSKTYYTRSGAEGNYIYKIVSSPTTAGLNTYYENTRETTTIYWKDKQGFFGLFGKASWDECKNEQLIIGYAWSNLNKKLTPSGKLLLSDNGYNLRFVCFNEKSREYLQYNFGQNASPIFSVSSISSTNFTAIAEKTGFYKITGLDNESWAFKDSGQSLGVIDSSKSFTVEYLKEIPKYSNETDWPSWLNNKPDFYKNSLKVTSDLDILNSDGMKVKVSLDAYYRYYKVIDDVETPNGFYKLEEGGELKEKPDDNTGVLINTKQNKTVKFGRYYNQQWVNPDTIPSFPYDRANSIGKTPPSIGDNYLPKWLRFETEMKVKFNAEPKKDYTATYAGRHNLFDIGGWYKWLKEIDEECVEKEVVDNVSCIKYLPTDASVDKEWMKGQFKPNTQYTMTYRAKNIAGISSGIFIFYTDKTFTGEYIQSSDEFDEITIITEAGKSVDYIMMSSAATGGIYIDENSVMLYEYDATETYKYIPYGYFLWQTIPKEASELPKVFYTKEYWYGDKNNKTFDEDGNEIGYIVDGPTIYFYPGVSPIESSTKEGGFYKYDNSTVWVYHEYKKTEDNAEPIEPIIKINYRDTTTIYFIESFPETYSEGDTVPEWNQYLEIERSPSGNNNPLTIKFKVKEGKGGYYKSNSLVHWKRYEEGDIVLESLVNETNTITRLEKKSDEQLANIEIVVTPKWWML